jgi:hypothetical protein
MTCILFTQKRIYTDTLHINEAGEEFHSLNKVKCLRAGIPVNWTPMANRPVSEESNVEAFTDVIHGYTCSGNNVVANRFIDSLGNELKSVVRAYDPHAKDNATDVVRVATENNLAASLNALVNLYEFVALAGFVNSANMATIILIGEKACYAVEFDSRTAELGRLSRDNPTSYGTGAPYASKMLFTSGDPLLALYTAMWYDSNQTGGMIDIWEMPTVEKPVLRRVGACNRRSLADLRDIIISPILPDNPLPPDLVANDLFEEKLEALAELAEQVGYDRGAGKINDPKNRAAKAIATKGATERLLKAHRAKLNAPSGKATKKASKPTTKPRKPK